MSWAVVLGLAAGAYAFKAAGLLAGARRTLPAWLAQVAALLPATLLAAVVVTQTFAGGESVAIDARVAGVAAGAVAVVLRAPFVVVLVVAAAVAAGIRLIT